MVLQKQETSEAMQTGEGEGSLGSNLGLRGVELEKSK